MNHKGKSFIGKIVFICEIFDDDDYDDDNNNRVDDEVGRENESVCMRCSNT